MIFELSVKVLMDEASTLHRSHVMLTPEKRLSGFTNKNGPIERMINEPQLRPEEKKNQTVIGR